MAANPIVSVIVITYKQEKFIGHTLESIVSQKTDFEYEVLVGDDCSPDNTGKIVKEYTEKYPDLITPFIREKNLGMTGNMSELFTHVRGKYVALLEGDDYWVDEKKLQKQVDFLESHPDYVACFGNYMVVDENEVHHPEREHTGTFMHAKGDYTIKEFEKYIMPGQTATAMYRVVAFGELPKKIIEAQIDPKKMIDRYQILCMLSVGKIYTIGEVLAAYRYMTDPSSGSWSSKNEGYNKTNILNYLDGMKDMERIAKALGMELNFDEHRKYELIKFINNKKQLPKKDAKEIKKAFINDSNDKTSMRLHYIRKSLGKIKRGIKYKLKRKK